MKKRKAKKMNKQTEKQSAPAKEILFSNLIAEKRRISNMMMDNEAKCYDFFIGDISNKLSTCSNQKQVQLIERSIMNDSKSFIKSFESLKRVCIYGTVKEKNIVSPIETEIAKKLEDIWERYGNEVMNY